MLAFSIHHWLLLLCLSVAALGEADAIRSMSPPFPTRSNFLRAAVLGGRREPLLCTTAPGVCSDRKKNPWGGSTCCFQRYCKDTARDPDHCGDCGRRCAYGLLCCGGECTDVRDDSDHCGSCYNRCTAGIRCSFGMCNYGH